MATNTIILIALVAIVVVLILVALGVVLRNKRTEHRRVEAGDVRDRATEQSHKVGQREALADETAANARVAQAEADAKTAHAAGLQHRAETRRSDAATARHDVDEEYLRADKIDPDSQTPDTPREDPQTRDTRQGPPNDTQSPRQVHIAG